MYMLQDKKSCKKKNLFQLINLKKRKNILQYFSFQKKHTDVYFLLTHFYIIYRIFMLVTEENI